MSTLLTSIWVNFVGLLLKLVHFGYSVFECLDLGWLLLKRKYSDVLDLEVFDSQLFVSEFVRKLQKRPSHFVVIVGEDGINVNDFSNLVAWCLAAKISFVSFYDYSGYLKANQHMYYKHLTEEKKVDPKCLRFDIEKASAKNGILQKIHLNILSLEDGKPLLVELSKKLSRNVISNKLQLGEINERLISDELYRFSGLPEPDLVLVSGKTFGTFGFLPWHIRENKELEWNEDVGIHFNAPHVFIVHPEIRKMSWRACTVHRVPEAVRQVHSTGILSWTVTKCVFLAKQRPQNDSLKDTTFWFWIPNHVGYISLQFYNPSWCFLGFKSNKNQSNVYFVRGSYDVKSSGVASSVQ